MADKSAERRELRLLKHIKTWQLLILFVLCCFVSATFLRINNVGMVQRRSAVSAADKSGDSTQMYARIQELRSYTQSHMNADTGVIYLQYQYNRDSEAAIKKASEQSSENANLNAQAEAICHPQYSGWSHAYINCFVNALNDLSKNTSSSELSQPDLPNTELYRYEYASPAWSPDFAGWSIVVAGLILFMIIARLIAMVVLRILLRRRYRAA